MKQLVGSEEISDSYLYALLCVLCVIVGVAIFLVIRRLNMPASSASVSRYRGGKPFGGM
jgi:hypothetical protein